VQLLKDHFGPDNIDSAKLKMAQVGNWRKGMVGGEKNKLFLK
jgi:hypothetical protein